MDQMDKQNLMKRVLEILKERHAEEKENEQKA
jgi:hypothetical protein